MTGNRRQVSPRADYAFAAVDARSRLAYVEVRENERMESAAAFLLAALRYYRGMGVRISTVMTEGARVFRSRRFQRVLRWLGIRHKTTPPYTPVSYTHLTLPTKA